MKQGVKRTTAAILAALILAGAGTSVAVFSGVGSSVAEAAETTQNQTQPAEKSASSSPVETTDTTNESWEECTECSAEHPHMISTAADLDKIRTHTHTEDDTTKITGYFKLANDIVFTDEDFEENGAFYNDGGGWIPIGHNEKSNYYSGIKFSGDFNGDTHSIKNLKINHPAQYWYNGLFAAFEDNAHIYNLSLDGFNIKADGAGILCGQGYGTNTCIENIEILNCNLTGLNTATKKSALLIGNTQGGIIRNIRITNSSYDQENYAWGGSFIASEFLTGVIENVTITNCSLKPYAYSGLLVSSISRDTTIRNIAIRDCDIIPTHFNWNYFIHDDNRTTTEDTISLSNIVMDVTISPTYSNDSGITTVMKPKEGFSPVSMDNVTISAKFKKGDDSETVNALFQKNAIYISDNIQELNVGKLIGNPHEIVTYLNGGTFPANTTFTANTLATPVKDGYQFGGWYDNESFSDNAVTTPETGKTYYAKWTESTDYNVDVSNKDIDFGEMTYGREVPSGQTVTVTGLVDDAKIDKVVSSSEAFTAAYDSMDVTITPADHLDAGTYTETVYVYTGDGATHWINVTLTVKKAPLTATYEDETIYEGQKPALEVTVIGFVNGQTAETADGYKAPTIENNNTSTGSYTLTPSGGSATNYDFTYIPGTLTIRTRSGGGGTIVTPPGEPEKPAVDQVQNLKAVKKSTTWLKLNFDQVEGADGYEIYNAETGEKLADCTTQNGRAVLTKTVTGLSKGTTYKLQVRAYKLVDGEKVYGDFSKVYTKATAYLDKVTGVRPIKKTQTTLKIQFNKVEGAERYKIFDAETGKMLCTVSTQNGADVLKKTITGLKAGERRQYKVRAYATINGKSEYSEFSKTLVKATAE